MSNGAAVPSRFFVPTDELLDRAVEAYGEGCSREALARAVESVVAPMLIAQATREAAIIAKVTAENCARIADAHKVPGPAPDKEKHLQFQRGAELAKAIAIGILSRAGFIPGAIARAPDAVTAIITPPGRPN